MLYTSKTINNSLNKILTNPIIAHLSQCKNNISNNPFFTNPHHSYNNISHYRLSYQQINSHPKSMRIPNFFFNLVGYKFSTISQKNLTIQADRDISTVQEIIEVKAEKQEMLFFDSQTLTANIKLNLQRKKMQNIHKSKGHIINQNQNQLYLLNRKATSIIDYNQHLAKGLFSQYKDYPIPKLTQICLKFINLHHHTPHHQLYGKIIPLQHWKSLEYFIRKRMHNCSLKDYMKILSIVLRSYHSIYQFNLQFIHSLIRGVKMQLPLMEENQLMQLYLILSQKNIEERHLWEMQLRHSQTKNPRLKNQERIKSQFYENDSLCTIQQEIAEKMVRKYQKKYLKTDLFLKREDLLKITWWLKTIILYHNSKLSQLKDSNMNEMKNRYIVGLVKVIVSKFVTLNSEQTNKVPLIGSNEVKKSVVNNSRLIGCQFLDLKSVEELVEFVGVLGVVREYLNGEGERQLGREKGEEKDKQLIDKGSIWVEKSNQANQVLLTILGYDNVKLLINQLFQNQQTPSIEQHKAQTEQSLQGLNNQQNTQGKTIQKQPQITQQQRQQQTLSDRLKKNMKRFELLKLITQCHQFQNHHSSHSWCLQVLSQFNILELFGSTHQLLNNLIQKDQTQQSEKVSHYSPQKQQLIKLGLNQFHILYLIYDNLYYINKLKKHQFQTQNGKLNLKDLWIHYQHIVESCFSSQLLADKISQLIPPVYITNIIHLQLSFNHIHQQPLYQFPALNLITKYTQQILGLNNSSHDNKTNNTLYIRQLQLPLYTYLILAIKYANSPHSQQAKAIFFLAQQLKSRNQLAKQYLQQNNHLYQSITNNQNHINPFIKQQTYLSPHQSHNSLTLQKNHPHPNNFSKNTSLLANFIIKSITIQKNTYLTNQDIVKLTKFFTQIKAFNQLKFSYPIGPFLTCPQFVFAYNKKNNINLSPKILLFLSPEELVKPHIISEKAIFQASGIQTILIDRREFLNLHINERIQRLNELLFTKTTQNKIQKLLAQ